MSPEQLNPKLQKLYKFYMDRKNWRPPTFEAMKIHMNFKSKNAIMKRLKQLKASGHIEQT